MESPGNPQSIDGEFRREFPGDALRNPLGQSLGNTLGNAEGFTGSPESAILAGLIEPPNPLPVPRWQSDISPRMGNIIHKIENVSPIKGRISSTNSYGTLNLGMGLQLPAWEQKRNVI